LLAHIYIIGSAIHSTRDKRPVTAKQCAVEIIRTLRERGHQAYLVGGCVRDLLLHREPADYDVATDATPDQTMRIFPRSFGVGAQFGVVLVPLYRNPPESAEGIPEHEKAVEVATFRSDGTYTDGRHPDQVRYTKDPREDVQRRDFTINGLLLDPLDGERVLDYVDGQRDIELGIIRTIGDAERRFQEDKLRMLRAVRFAARFGYDIDPQARRRCWHVVLPPSAATPGTRPDLAVVVVGVAGRLRCRRLPVEPSRLRRRRMTGR
jgi:poly(A) polymerase